MEKITKPKGTEMMIVRDAKRLYQSRIHPAQVLMVRPNDEAEKTRIYTDA